MTDNHTYTISEQIKLLEQEGINIPDKALAEHYLSWVGYHHLKGYSWDIKRTHNTENFGEYCCFEDIIARYHFDKELRLILFDAIQSIEIALRTQMIIYLSQSYGYLYYTDPDLFSNKALHQQHLQNLLDEFMRSGESSIKAYKTKYGVWSGDRCVALQTLPSVWLIFEVATFGTLSKLYKNLQDQLPEKSRIAQNFGLNMHNELSSWLEAISYLRNIIAHHARIWRRNIVKRPMRLKNPRLPWLNTPLTKYSETTPYSIIISMLYLCKAIDPKAPYAERIITLIKKNPSIPVSQIGLIEGWDREPVWDR